MLAAPIGHLTMMTTKKRSFYSDDVKHAQVMINASILSCFLFSLTSSAPTEQIPQSLHLQCDISAFWKIWPDFLIMLGLLFAPPFPIQETSTEAVTVAIPAAKLKSSQFEVIAAKFVTTQAALHPVPADNTCLCLFEEDLPLRSPQTSIQQLW